MKLWIIYKNGIGFSKIIAEMLQDQLEDYIDVDVGEARKIDPDYLVEEKLDFLIIGDIISGEIPSLEIQDWILKYWELLNKKKNFLKVISGYYVVLADIKVKPFWVEFLDNIVKEAEIKFLPVLRLKLNKVGFGLEKGALELVKEFSNNIIESIINKDKQ